MSVHPPGFKLGPYDVYTISDGLFSVDAGTMFANVAKTTWSRFVRTDDENRLQLALNALLIRTGQTNILVNAGVGDKLSEKLSRRYRVDHRQDLLSSLRGIGVGPEDVDLVVFTHLHFDHCGGTTVLVDGVSTPVFPNAHYIIQQSEWAEAMNTNELTKGGYLEENILPLADRVILVSGSCTMEDWNCPGVRLHWTGGHSLGHQIVEIVANSRKAAYLSDLVPTTHHAHLPYLTGYDMEPLQLLECKKHWLSRCTKEGHIIFWEHDTSMPFSKMVLRNGRYTACPLNHSACAEN